MSHLHDKEKKQVEGSVIEATETIETLESRWKYAVFPAMIAFAILSSFGFYLIYGMLQHMESLSKDVAQMSKVIQKTMPAMQENIAVMPVMQRNMNRISDDVNQLSTVIATNIPPLNKSVVEMNQSTASMARTTQNMGNNIWELNKNVSKPFSVMNKMIPWSTTGKAPQAVSFYPQRAN